MNQDRRFWVAIMRIMDATVAARHGTGLMEVCVKSRERIEIVLLQCRDHSSSEF
ncbi:hypothetical protein [Bradyrhizobium sp. 5.13L]